MLISDRPSKFSFCYFKGFLKGCHLLGLLEYLNLAVLSFDIDKPSNLWIVKLWIFCVPLHLFRFEGEKEEIDDIDEIKHLPMLKK